jgi:hypothetical protein
MTRRSQDIALVHIFRFEGDLMTELWDISQPQPEILEISTNVLLESAFTSM